MHHLRSIEHRSLFIIREVWARSRKAALLFSGGKDSTVLLHLCRKAFFGQIPFDVVTIDTRFQFSETAAFCDMLTESWGVPLRLVSNDAARSQGIGPDSGALECCSRLKTDVLNSLVASCAYDVLLVGIRRDEHDVRAKERFFSPRDREGNWDVRHQPFEMWGTFRLRTPEKTAQNPSGSSFQTDGHTRVHPLLEWRERDVWQYIEQEQLPVNPLYFSKDGRRYRSLGCAPCTIPIESNARTVGEVIQELERTHASERAARLMDKERAFMMQKLRAIGYM